MRAHSSLAAAGRMPRRAGYAPKLDLRAVTRAPRSGAQPPQQVNSERVEVRLLVRAWQARRPRTRRHSKRAFDIITATVLLFPALPVMLVLGCAVKLTSRGPVFYQSERHGVGQTRFSAWKLRSMVPEARQTERLQENNQYRSDLARDFKLRDDPRVTVVGYKLRRTSLDELPQLFNVLRGEMSMVGPRPKLIAEQPRYGAAFHPIMSVKPGLTGLWQTSGRNNLSFDERVMLDLRYVADNSMRQDIVICLRTARQMTQPGLHGAY